MAKIQAATIKTFRVDKWLGLNEAPDGDGKLKYGEASQCRNWQVTRDGNLRRRPGTKTLCALGGGGIRRLWSGRVGAEEVLLAATGTGLYAIKPDGTVPIRAVVDAGELSAGGAVSIFGFGGLAYVLDGTEYRVWDGSELRAVEGYVPLVFVAVVPGGGGTALEPVNMLTGKRRCRFSPDGAATVFQLPEKGLASIDCVKDLTTGSEVTGWTADTDAGTVTFPAPPDKGVSSLEVWWTYPENFRGQITSMLYWEFYNGANDNRVFLYGNGTNKIYYSGLDYDGHPRADYFPDMNEVKVGTENTPVTGVIKHYSRLIVYKPSETYTIAYGTTTLADGSVTPVFYLTPVNRSLGNEAPGQVQLVLNSPRTLCAGAVYEWRNNSSYTANLTLDERQARRLSDRAARTLEGFTLSECVCWDDNAAQEYYIACGAAALVHNYAVDAWYAYYGFPAAAFVRHGGELYIGGADGIIRHVSRQYDGDDGAAVSAYWETGSIDFGAAARKKYACELWLACAPVEKGALTVGAKSDRAERKTEAVTKSAAAAFDFSALDFSALAFDYDRLAQAKHLRLRLRRFTFCKLFFRAERTDASAGIMGITMNVTYGGESR